MTPQDKLGQKQEVSIDEWEDMVRERYQVPRNLWKAMSTQESGGNWDAVSPTGVKGKWQVTEATAKQYGLDRNDPYQQVVAAAKYLRDQYEGLKDVPDDNARWLGAVGRYYGGPGAVGGDGSISTKSPDGVSAPDKHIERVAKLWGQFEKGGEAPAPTDFSGKPVTPQPVKQQQEVKFQSPRPPVTSKRGPIRDVKPLGFGGDPTQQMMQDVAARSKQVKAVPRQPTEFEKRSPLGQAGEILTTGILHGGVEGLYKGLSYLNPLPSPYKGKGLLTPEAEQAMQQQEAAQDQAMPLAAPVARGLATAGVQAPAYMLGGAGGMGAGMLTAAGLSAAQEDWSKDPVRSAVRVGINATLPFAASRGANALIRPVTAPGVAATEAIAGAAGNVVPEGIEQMAFEGKLDPQRLAQTGLIGALSPLNVTGAGRQADANKLSRIQKATGSPATAPASETPALTPDQVFGPDDFDPAATAPPPVDPQRPIQSRMQAIGTDTPVNSGRYVPTPEVQKGVEVADKARTQAESARANQDAAAEVRSLEGERQAIKAAMRGAGMKDAVGRRALGERLAGIEQDIAKAKANARQSGRSTPEQRPVPETVTPEAARDIADDPTADLTGDLAPLPEQTAPITEDLVPPTGALPEQADVATPAIRPQYGRRTGTPVPGEAQRTGPRKGRQVRVNNKDVNLTPEQSKAWDEAEARHKETVTMIEQDRVADSVDRAKRLKAEGMRHAARKREIAGALTDKEQSAKDKREASNYKGKSVSVNGKNGKVVGNPFGRVKIEFDDGTVATVAPDAVQAATPTADSPAKAPSRWAARENVQGSRGQRSGIPVPSKATDTQPTDALPEQPPADLRSGVTTIYGRRAGTPLPPRVGEPAPKRITKEIPRERTQAQESVRTAIEDAKARRKPPAPPKPAGVRPEVLAQKQLEDSGMPIDPTTGQGQTLMYGARPHHQKRLNEQGRAIVAEQQQKVRETAGEADPRYQLAEGDFKGNNYVKLGTDIAGKTAQHLFRTNTKKSLEGISEKGGLGEDLAFFLDPHVQGALGLTKSATSKEAKARLNRELAAIMNIRDAQGNIPEISLRSVPEDVWRMWARRKELPASSMARFNKAVRVARGEITNDTTPPAAPDAAIPQRREAPMRSAQASDTGRPVARAAAETPAASRAVEPVAEPAAARAAERTAEPRAAEPVAETYHKGDRARYTGKTEEHYGQTFYEIEILEGHLQGQKFLKDAPMGEVSPNVERQRREFRADQENWRKLREGEKRAAQTEQANPAQSLPPARQQKPKSPSRPKASPKPPSKENKGSAIARAQLNSEERAQLEQAKQYLRDIINDKVEFDTPADRAAAIMNEREKISELQSQLYSDAALRIVEREQGPEAAARARQVSKAEPVAETPQEGAGMSRDESVALAKAERTPATPKPARKAAPQEAASPAKTAPKVNEKTLTDTGWQKKSPADYKHPDGRRISRNERNRWEITRESGEGTQTFDTLRDAIVAATGEPAAKPAKPVKPSPMADDVLIKPQPEMPEDAMPLPPTSKPYNMPDPEPQPQRAAKPAEQAAKEPWQMTREEYRTFDPNGNYDQMIRRAAIVGHISYDDADKLSIIDGMGNKQFWAKTRTELETEKKNAINSGKRERADINKIKADKHFAPWRVRSMSRTAKGHIQHTTDYYDGLLAVHKERVQEALAEGKPVPPEVLADYPDLAPKAATDQPARVEKAKARRAAKPKAAAKAKQPEAPPAETGSLAETQAKRADLKARSPFAKAKAETVADAEAAFKQAQAEFDEAYKPVTELDNDMTRMGQISPKDRRKYGMSNQNRLNPADVYKKYGVKNRHGLVAELEKRKAAAKPANDRMVEAYNRLEALKKQGQSDKPRIVTEAEARLRDSASGKLAGSGAQAIADQAIVTGYKVYKQGMAFSDWTRSMLREFGGKVRPYLRDTWAKLTAAAKEFYRDQEGSAPASPGPPRRNRVTNAVRENAAKEPPRRSPYADLLEQINQDQLRQPQPAPKGEKTPKNEQPMTRSEKLAHNIVTLSGIPRALQATGDFSAPLRQGAILFLPPTQWKRSLRAMGDMFASLSPQAHNRLRDRIHKSPNIDIAKESGLYLATDAVGSNVITGREEDFISNAFSKWPVLKQTAGPIVKASERTYTGFLDSLRMSTFDSYKKTIDKSGGTPEQKAAAYKSAAKWINYATGRGSLGKSFDNAAPLLSTIFFAPRYVASRVNVLNPGTYTAMPRAVAKRALGDLAQYAGMVAMTAYLAKLNGAEVSLDPEDADFLKLKFGDTRYDFLAGTQQVMRLFYRTGKDMIQSAEGQPAERGKTAIDVTGRFARSKLAPVPSFFMDMVSRKNYIGEPFKADKAVVERVVPLLWKDFYEAYEKEAGLGVLKTSPAVFGAGVQTYKPRTAAPKPLASSTRRRATRRRATRRESIG